MNRTRTMFLVGMYLGAYLIAALLAKKLFVVGCIVVAATLCVFAMKAGDTDREEAAE